MNKKVLLSLFSASMLISANVSASDHNDPNFRYYFVTCLDKTTHTQLWFDISRYWDNAWGARCHAENGYLDVEKVYWQVER
ncbi:hypothetical protein [Pseudoalteromonas umbrosa]|uniref:hypothetical protein n=1 Tax=Pseudoalteromonas umbrosa TaxID=3048489 RepID=UPI0024C27E1D|nr:hypothetical protein [Pseudoalteromonas sp. B95]MDK1285805.1 hypothetical protein [Pseudoalteromonas sp. B95]